MATVQAIRPEDVVSQKRDSIPNEVIECFNELIVENYNGAYATVYQEDVVKRIVAKGIGREKIFKNSWLDVEEIFEAEGWRVEYDKPGYCESYEAHFKFEAKR
jgi:hypothetical protein